MNCSVKLSLLFKTEISIIVNFILYHVMPELHNILLYYIFQTQSLSIIALLKIEHYNI